MKKALFILISILILSSCYKGKSVDLIIHNANIHTMDETNDISQAIAIKDGKIVELGPERQILNKYSADEIIDAEGKDIYPGLTDCHGHILSYADQKLSVDLVGAKSMDEVLFRTEKYQSKHHRKFILGRGWDQSLWGTTEFPTNESLNKQFPDIPVCLIRIDGHALLANDKLLEMAGINSESNIEGGIIHLKNGKCTGFLVDNAMLPVQNLVPEYPVKEKISAILEIQEELLQYGITGVHEAGIDFEDIELFKNLIDQHGLTINVYAMLMPSEKNISFAEKHGIYSYKNLLIRSFKVMGDGALGSRGAFLKHDYEDEPGHKGVLTNSVEFMNRVASIAMKFGYQMNTHAIGDSTNKIMLKMYERIFSENPDHRWRIEHAQVVDPSDFSLFSKYGVFPSVQPSHAVSDQRWAEARIGVNRMKGAYAYRTLLDHYGMLAIGTDFPIEYIDPFNTIHAAVRRQNQENYPAGGFYIDQSITLEQCLKGMTIWAAFASFQENELGSLEKGKDATLVIFDEPIVDRSEYKANFAWKTFVKGRQKYSVN